MNKEPTEKLTEMLAMRITKKALMQLKAEAKAAGFSSVAEYMRVVKLNKEKS